MMSSLAEHLGRWAACSAMIALTGCASSVAFKSIQPVDGPGLGARRVSVLELSGPEELTSLARTELTDRLKSVGFYEIIDPPNVPTVAQASFRPGLDRHTEWARNRGVDTFVQGKIYKTYEQNGSAAGVTFGDPTLKVVLTLELVDAERGRILATETVESSDRTDMESQPADAGSEANVARQLTRRCVQKATSTLFAREETVHTKLAGAGYGLGASGVRRGNRLARNGQWAEAKIEYVKALNEDPRNHAVAFNLGVANEALHNYGTAKQMYAMAARLEEREEYRDAERRVARTMDQYQVAATKRRMGVSSARPALVTGPVTPRPSSSPAAAAPPAARSQLVSHRTAYNNPPIRRLPAVR